MIFKNSFPSKVAWKRIFSNLCIFKSLFFNTKLINDFSIPYFSICIPLIQLSNWISIQFNLHTMSFKIFILMEFNFHKITSFLLSIDQSMIARSAWQHRIWVYYVITLWINQNFESIFWTYISYHHKIKF